MCLWLNDSFMAILIPRCIKLVCIKYLSMYSFLNMNHTLIKCFILKTVDNKFKLLLCYETI
jgi:hypothetical protein